MGYIPQEDKEKFYDIYPPGTRVLIFDRQEWVPGEVVDRYGAAGTVKIVCKMDSGEQFIVLYGRRGSIRLAEAK